MAESNQGSTAITKVYTEALSPTSVPINDTVAGEPGYIGIVVVRDR